MRVLLRIFVLATAAVVWAAGSHGPEPVRASCARPGALGPADMVPGVVLGAREQPSETEPREGALATTGDDAAELRIVPLEVPEADGVSVEVLLVDGENGRVLRRSMTAVRRGVEGTVAFDVAAPYGYVAELSPTREVKGFISRRADLVRVVEPLRREANIRLRVLDAAGRPALGAQVTHVLQGGDGPSTVVAYLGRGEEPRFPDPSSEWVVEERDRLPQAHAEPADADGWTRVRGVPDLLDERYWIVAGRGEVEAFTEVRLGQLGQRYAPEIRLPAARARFIASNDAIGLGGCCGCSRRGKGPRRQVPATLTVVVRREDGRMGVGVDVHVGAAKAVTDAGGRATFAGLQPGAHSVEVRDPDFIWSKASVDLGAGESRTFVLEEAPGWTARLALVDSLGRPAPFARVEMMSKAPVPYLRLEDGVQDLVLYTDVNGEIRLPGMHHAPVDLTFSYGSRSASVTLQESDPYATVQLPPP